MHVRVQGGGGGGGGDEEAKDQLKHLMGQLFMLEIYIDHKGGGGGANVPCSHFN